MDFYSYDDGKAMEEMATILPHLKNIINHLAQIEESDDKEFIEILISQIEQEETFIASIWGPKQYTTMEAIRQRSGDFAKITDKCIQLGII
jgi:hypothetical protein